MLHLVMVIVILGESLVVQQRDNPKIINKDHPLIAILGGEEISTTIVVVEVEVEVVDEVEEEEEGVVEEEVEEEAEEVEDHMRMEEVLR